MSKPNSQTQSSTSGVLVMDADAIARALRRLAHEIVERNPALETIVLAGIPSGAAVR